MSFVDYNGKIINLPIHSHDIATTTINGFMSKEDKIKFDELVNYKTTLIKGIDFKTELKTVGPNATSIIFTESKIPDDKISYAEIVSTNDSEVKCYMYLEDTTLYISSEKDDTIIYANKDCSHMFDHLENNLKIINFINFNTFNVTNMSYMFTFNTYLTSIIGLENFNTSNVTDMKYIFSFNDYLTVLDVSNFNTSKVTSMECMFHRNMSLTSLDVSNFNTSNVTSMNNMFNDCSNLTNIIGLENFDTSKVNDMYGMFLNCNYLTSLDLSSFNTSNVTDMSNIFYYCNNLTNIIGLENFDTSKVNDMRDMFESCAKLSGSITIMNPNINSYSRMFYSCSTKPSAKFIVNYINDATKAKAVAMVATKSSNSNVVLGTLVK